MHSQYETKKKQTIIKLMASTVAILILASGVFALKPSTEKKEAAVLPPAENSKVEGSSTDNKTVAEEQSETKSTWPVTYTSEQAGSLTVVVNKKYRLPSDYIPPLTSIAGGQLRPEAASALQNMMSAAEQDGAPMVIVSSYRSYQNQVSTYQYWVDTQGQTQADRESARPGHSEHQTGLAVDMGNPNGSCRLIACFGTGVAGQWLAARAHEFGFIIRYPEGKEVDTGYIYEPWHLRYVGADIASAIHSSGQTIDQYFSVPAGDYNH